VCNWQVCSWRWFKLFAYCHISASPIEFFYCIFHVGMYIATKVVMSCLQYVVIMCYVTDCYYVLCHELFSVCLDYFFLELLSLNGSITIMGHHASVCSLLY
jgi:hypothetical protein